METLRMILAWPVLITVIGFMVWQWMRWQRKVFFNECAYEIFYQRIDRDIDEAPVSEGWYDTITFELTELGQMKHKNQEKTQVLSCKFWRKFTKIHLRRFIDGKGELGRIELSDMVNIWNESRFN